MKHMSMLCIMGVSLCVGSEAAQGTRWMTLTSNLPRIIQATNIRQGPDRLIDKGTVNVSTFFVFNRGRIIPLLPESFKASVHRCDTAQEREKKQRSLKGAELSASFCGPLIGVPLVAGISDALQVGLSWNNTYLFGAAAAGLVGAGASLYRIHRLCQTLNNEKFRNLDEWCAENREVILSTKDKQKVLDALQKHRCHNLILQHLENITMKWYYPHGDWTKFVGHNGVHEEHVIQPSSRTNPRAFPVVELPNLVMTEQFPHDAHV